MREPAPTPYEIIARNIKVKLALRVKSPITVYTEGHEIYISIGRCEFRYSTTLLIKDLNEADSSVMSENIYNSYRKFIMRKFFTFD